MEAFSNWGNGTAQPGKSDDFDFMAWVDRHASSDKAAQAEQVARDLVEQLCAEELAEAISQSSSTREQYLAEVRNFAQHCRHMGIPPAPVGPGVVAAYLVCRIADGVGLIRAQRIVSAIADLHSANNHPDPTASVYVRAAIKRLRKQTKGKKTNGKAHH